MTHQSRVKAFFKGIGVWVVGYMLLIFTLMLVLFAIVFVVGKTNPEALKSWFKS
jgi:hypothetical protein